MRHSTVEQLTQSLKRFDSEAVRVLIPTPRYQMRAISWGDPKAKPVVLIHGLCDQMRSFAMLMAELVNRGYRCLGYELADGRRDGARLSYYRHEDFTNDLLCLLDHFELDSVYLFGSSFGSTITLRSLATVPSRFSKACIQGGFARRPLNGAEYTLAMLGRQWPWLMGQLPVRRLVMRQLEKPQFVGCPDEIFQYLLASSGATPVRAAAYRALMLHKLDLRPLLSQIQQPLLMIGGNIDLIVPRSAEAEVEAGIPQARRHEFQPCGHYPQYTLPTDTAHILDEFFRS